jgi:protein-disulfide isomerase
MLLGKDEASKKDRIAAIVMAVLAASGILCAVLVGSGGVPSLAMTKPPEAAKLKGKVAERPDDLALGDPNAPIQVVEYASLACSHCATMDKEVLPRLKEKYIDTGKVRYIYRDFPLNPFGTAAAMAAHCRGDEHFFDTISVIFSLQAWWLGGASDEADAMARLATVMRETGMSKAEFDRCVQDEALFARVRDVSEKGEREFGVNSTPTFIVNGKTHVGELSFERFEAILAPLLPKP